MTANSHRRLLAGFLLPVLLVACSGPSPSSSLSSSASSSASSLATGRPSGSGVAGGIGTIVPAPGSDSSVYGPNPGAIVVAIDPGHGGCLDWGVPDPRRRGVEFSEKTMTLAIGQQLRDMLEAQGVTVVMTRDDDSALAGDDYPPLGCNGPSWRDVNGDGESGFDPEGAVRTRDELQARLDLANIARADVLLSIHINSLTQGGVVFEIAATETFYTDETTWGVAVTGPLAQAIQDEVLTSMDRAAGYDRQDRGIQAHNLFIVAPPLLKATSDRPDTRKQPTRGALMPSILTEVGSITLEAEQNLLASPAGQQAAAEGIFAALARHFAARSLAVAYLLPELEPGPGPVPTAAAGDGPPFWPPVAPSNELVVRLTNTGNQPWPAGMQLLGGWQASDQPYLRLPPASLEPLLSDAIPSLAPGDAVDVRVTVPAAVTEVGVAWITLAGDDGPLTDLGSPPLQVATRGRTAG
ncbi:MAG TPA: N-acetylmuramoyl-L-alanine amidase [Candidatus Limnocylindrales bacterium]|nr:N-acetylmuramoyl-L-alanine amidase [Candidatus Limnocylindrales bacterium]